MKYDLQAPNAKRVYRLITKGAEPLLYVLAHNVSQAISMAKKSGYIVLSASKWND